MNLSAGMPPPDRETIKGLLEREDPQVLALTLFHNTGDPEVFAALEKYAAAEDDGGEEKETFDAEVVERLLAFIDTAGDGGSGEPAVDHGTLVKMIRLAVKEPMSDDYVEMMMDQAHLTYAGADRADKQAFVADPDTDFQVVVVGAGLSGICAAIELKRRNIPFVVLERDRSPGGTWHRNNYPGCGVDTPSFFYSFSFAQYPDWSHYFAKREEVIRYVEKCIENFGLAEHIRYGCDVEALHFDEALNRWDVGYTDADGHRTEIAASALFVAVGQLNIPQIPKLKGIEAFEGVVQHTGEWDPAIETKGKAIAMIGVGASAMQFGPTVAPEADKLLVFQRSPQWILPNNDYHRPIGEEQKWLLRHLPFLANWIRAKMIWTYGDAVFPALRKDKDWPKPKQSLNALSERLRNYMIRHIRKELDGRPDLIEKCIPEYPPYGKRVLLDNGWYKMLRRENVELIESGIAEVERDAIVTADGVRHKVDVIAYATGFEASRMLAPIDIRGRNDIALRDVWGEDNPRAYLGITVPGFPNLFLLYGPNTNLGFGGSAIFNSECQVRYAMGCIEAMLEHGWTSLECKQDVHDAYNQVVDDTHAELVWTCENVNNWYRNDAGRVTTNSPWRLGEYWRLTLAPNLEDFLVETKGAAGKPSMDLSASVPGGGR